MRIVSEEKADKVQNLISRPHVIQGDPEELVEISWEDEVKLDLS